MKKVLMIAVAALAMAVGSFAYATAPPATRIDKSNVSLYLPDATLPSAAIVSRADATGLIATPIGKRTCPALLEGNKLTVENSAAEADDSVSAMPGGASLGVASRRAHSFYT